MTLIHFINILQRRILLIILVPLFLAGSVYIFTRKQARSYMSETTIYTGVGSGYSVQQQSTRDFMTNTIAYDNLINLINARQTLEEVSVRLLAQELLLDNYDPKYIQQQNYEALMESVPPEIIQIVRKYKRSQRKQYYQPPQKTSDLNSDDSDGPSASPLRGSVSSDPKNSKPQGYHIVKIGETLYALAKRYRISVEELMSLNDLESYELSAGQRIRINNQIASNSSLIEPNPYPAANTASKDTFSDDYTGEIDEKPLITRTWISDSPSHSDADSTSQNELLIKELMKYAASNDYNWIYQMWSSDNKFYSIKALSAVSINRIQSSDLIKVSYTCQDPGICQQTLIFLTETFIRNYKRLKQNQTDAVIAYFKSQVEDAMRRLNNAERQLLQFNEKNSIINYYEQTKAIAISKEDLDVSYQNKQIAYAAADAAIKIIEKKLETHARLTLNSSSLLALRSELSNVTMEIVNLEIDLGNDSASIIQLAQLQDRATELKSKIRDIIDRLTMITSSVEGLPLKDLLYAWLNNVIAYEESKAALRVLAERKRYFQQTYEIFAPLGAEMKRIERLIGVTEEEFLQLLHDLNLAKLRQQDDELSTNLKVVDPPYYPLHPLSSKAMLLVLAAGVIGFVLIIALLLALEFFDLTIKTPERAERFIKLKIAGVYPQIIQKFVTEAYEMILSRLIEMLVQNIKLTVLQNNGNQSKKPILILLFSTRDTEGKTTIGVEITRKLKSFGENVLYLNYVKEQSPNHSFFNNEALIPSEDEAQYIIRENFFEAREVQDLIPGLDQTLLDEFNYILVEIPSLINNMYPLEFIKSFDISLLVVRANRSWTTADAIALKTFTDINIHSVKIVLNGVEMMYMDAILGELPKSRSRFRRTLKRILTLRFSEKTLI